MLKVKKLKMKIELKVLGPGCQKCQMLKQRTEEVIIENNIDATIEKVEDMMEIMEYDVMNTPALVVNNKVVVSGRVPTRKEILSCILSETRLDDTTNPTCDCGGNC